MKFLSTASEWFISISTVAWMLFVVSQGYFYAEFRPAKAAEIAGNEFAYKIIGNPGKTRELGGIKFLSPSDPRNRIDLPSPAEIELLMNEPEGWK